MHPTMNCLTLRLQSYLELEIQRGFYNLQDEIIPLSLGSTIFPYVKLIKIKHQAAQRMFGRAVP